MFGNHKPISETQKSAVSPFATFTRGPLIPGRQWKYRFANGYGASVINDGYGHEQGLYEVAVLDGDSLTYDTPITDDVLGFLSEAEVAEVLDRIEALPSKAVTR